MKVGLNGEIVDAAGGIDPWDRGPALGDGLFETLAVRKGKIRRLPAHLGRLRMSAAAVGLPLTYEDLALERHIAAVVAANAVTEGAVRLVLTRGAPEPTLLIAAAAAAPETDPATVIVATAAQRNERSPLAWFKTLNARDNILARDEAAQAGADEALMLNSQGRVAGGTAANVFLLVNGGLVTPPMGEGAFLGVARADVIRLTRAEEKPVTVETLMRASEVFLSSALGVRPVIKIGGTPVGDGEPGLITQLVATRA